MIELACALVVLSLAARLRWRWRQHEPRAVRLLADPMQACECMACWADQLGVEILPRCERPTPTNKAGPGERYSA